jgi:hypothetical protein
MLLIEFNGPLPVSDGPLDLLKLRQLFIALLSMLHVVCGVQRVRDGVVADGVEYSIIQGVQGLQFLRQLVPHLLRVI